MLETTVTSDEASLYFRDPSYEHHPLFPRVSREALVDASMEKDRVPTNILLEGNGNGSLPLPPSGKESSFKLLLRSRNVDPDAWKASILSDGSSTVGTLDYSLDTWGLDDSRMLTGMDDEATTVVCDDIPDGEVKVEDPSDLLKLDVHLKQRDDIRDCLFGWLQELLRHKDGS